jgi:FolB domain-containing protein
MIFLFNNCVKEFNKMDKIFIKDLVARGIIGVNADEREKPQEITINTTIYINTSIAGQTDDISDTVSYSMLAKKIQACAESAQRFTVEALAEDIARLCLDEPGVRKVQVRVEKPRAVRFVSSVGVEIEREKSQ